MRLSPIIKLHYNFYKQKHTINLRMLQIWQLYSFPVKLCKQRITICFFTYVWNQYLRVFLEPPIHYSARVNERVRHFPVNDIVNVTAKVTQAMIAATQSVTT